MSELIADLFVSLDACASAVDVGPYFGYGGPELLALAQHAGTVRDDIQITEVMALLTSTCQGALQAGWDSDLQRRTLAVIFDGIRPQATP